MYFKDNKCVKEINGNLEVNGSTLIKCNLDVNGTSFLKEVRSRNTFTENNSYVSGNLEVKKDIKSDNIKINKNIEVEGVGLLKNMRVYETAEIKNLNTDTLTNTSDMNILKNLNVYGESNLKKIINEEINTEKIFNKENLFNFGRGFFYNNMFVGGNITNGGRIFTSGNLITGDSQFTRLNSFRGNLINFGLTPEEILNFLNDLNNTETLPLNMSLKSVNQEEKNKSKILNLIPDFAKEHPQFEKIIPIFDINQNQNNNNKGLMQKSSLINPFGLLDLNIDFGQLTFDINNSIYIGIGPSIQILPLITLFPSYFLTDINVNSNANINGDIYNYGNTNVSNNIYLGGDIIYTNEDNKTLSEKLDSINNKLNYIANKLGLTPEELIEFNNL